MTGSRGTAVSFEDVTDELADPLRRYLVRLVRDRSTADDLLQETLLNIARALPKFEGRSSLKTWAFSIATRVATDHFRRPDQRARIVNIDETECLPTSGLDVDDSLVIEEMSDCVRGVIDSLPGDYRTALVLHDLQGLTVAEVADVANCSLATAKIRIHRARCRLREALKQECTFYRGNEDVFRCDRKPGS